MKGKGHYFVKCVLKVFFLVNEASDVGSEWLLRASEGNQEILSDVAETQLSETANQIGRRLNVSDFISEILFR